MSKPLNEYHRKRNFELTSEPRGESSPGKEKVLAQSLRFVIQKHDARRLHYDFRLELGGTLKSWAIPKGPSLDPKDKRLAVHVEDHPLDYATFEGSIPQGQYGGGDVIVWDHGVWQPHDDPRKAYKAGKLKFTLIGEKLTGDWNLVRTRLPGSSDKEQWLLIKEQDQSARLANEYDIVADQPQSVISGAVLAPTKAAAKTIDSRSASKKNNHKGSPDKPSAAAVEDFSLDVEGSSTAKKKSTSEKSRQKMEVQKSRPRRSKKLELPDSFTPELATLVTEPPAGDWLYEIKFDGYRILARIKNAEVRLFTRNGNDWTERLPQQVKAIAALELGDSWLDGEVVVMNERGLPDFQALQNAFEIGRSHNILYYLFDAPFLNGIDLRTTPLEQRRAALEEIVPDQRRGPLRFSAAFGGDHRYIIKSACAMSLEGVIGKRAGSLYVSQRSADWIKLKCHLRQEFIIIGYSQPQGSRGGFGALLLGVHADTKKHELRYAGRVGTGFTATGLRELHRQLHKMERATPPLALSLTATQTRGVQWVEPQLVCEVEFAEWTGDDVLRQAVFIALRNDKPAAEIIREHALTRAEIKHKNTGPADGDRNPEQEKLKMDAEKIALKTKPGTHTRANGSEQVEQVKITHPERIIDPQSGATKKDLAIFYGKMSAWILPHLKQRPVALLRAPEGINGEQFFQKHSEHLAIPHIKQLDPALDPGHARLMEIDTPQALVGAAQMGAIELHTWGSASNSIEMPDRITLDLDPDPVLPWRSVVEATTLTLAVLDELKLDAYLKTTGGKGMHIVIPLAPRDDWETIKNFSKAIAQFMAHEIPERFVATMGPKNRVGKIFIDYLRNQRGASTVSAFSVRARPGLTVSVPIARNELAKLTGPAQWTIANLEQRLEILKGDPWDGFKHHQKITRLMQKKLGLL